MRVITVQVLLNSDDDGKAEDYILDLLKRDRTATDAEVLSDWQVTNISRFWPDWQREQEA